MSSSFIWQTPQPTYADHVAAAHRAPSTAIRAFVRFATERFRAWRRHRRWIAGIRDLEAFDDHQLADIGLSRQVIRETVEQLLGKER